MERQNTPPHESADIASPRSRTLTRRDLLAGSTAGAASLLLTGCGGGGSKTSNNNGGSSATITPVLADLQKRVADITNASPGTNSQTILQYMQSRSEFVTTGAEADGTVWGRFANGGVHAVFNTVQPDPSPASRAVTGGRASATRSNADLPGNDGGTSRVALLNALGSGFSYYHIIDERTLFPADYSLEKQTAFDVEYLKKLPALSILYFTAHGGVVRYTPTTTPFFAFSTSTVVTGDPQHDKAHPYYADIQAGNLTTGTTLEDWVPDPAHPGKYMITASTRYAIMPQFIRNYKWKLADRAFVFANACSGLALNTPDQVTAITDLRAALFGANVSIYAGWNSQPDNLRFNDTAAYMFDRMLGANKVTQIGNVTTGIRNVASSPQQRPFPLDIGLLNDMTNVGLTGYNVAAITLPGHVMIPAHLASLQYAPNPAQTAAFVILTPSIDYLDVQESTHTINVNGTFGTVPGTVTMNGNALNIQNWTATKIACDLPLTGGGDIVVTVNGHASPPHRLTQWILPIHYRGLPTGLGDSHTESVDMMLLMRVDVLNSRSGPGGSFNPPGNNIQPSPSPGSTGTYAVSGQYVGDLYGLHHVVTYTGSGALKPPDFPGLTGEIFFDPIFNFTPGALLLSFSVHTSNVGTDTAGNPGATVTSNVGFGLLSYNFGDAATGLINMMIDDNYNILSGMVSRSVLPSSNVGGQPNINATLTWDKTAPTPGTEPNPNQPRSAAHKSVSNVSPGRR